MNKSLHSILYLDPNGSICQKMSEIFQKAGYNIKTATEVREAKKYLAEEPPDFLVLEIELADANGFSLLTELDDQGKPPHIIVFTVHGNNHLFQRRAADLGASEYISKSLGVQALLTMVERYKNMTEQAKTRHNRGDHVLVVDDEPLICKLICRFLRQHGFKTASAHDAESALQQILEKEPLALLLDIQMPGRSGLELLQDLDARGIKPPTVIITGVEEHDVGIEAETLGIIGYLPKPFNINYLNKNILPKLEMLTG